MSVSALPSLTMWPVPSTYARSATESAICAFCSTSRIVVPVRVQLLDDLEYLLHQNRRETHGRLVQASAASACSSARGPWRASAVRRRRAGRPPGAGAPSGAESGSNTSIQRSRRSPPAGLRIAAHLQVLAHGHLLEDAPPLRAERGARPSETTLARRAWPATLVAVEGRC